MKHIRLKPIEEEKEIALFELEEIVKVLFPLFKNQTLIRQTTMTQNFISTWLGKRPKKYISIESDVSLYAKQFKRINELMTIIKCKKPKRIATRIYKQRSESTLGYKKALTGIKNQENLAILHKANPFVQLSMVM